MASYDIQNAKEYLQLLQKSLNILALTIAHYLAPLVGRAISLFVDIDGYRNPAMCFRTMRPDVLVDHDKMIVMELTVCFETNSIKSRECKIIIIISFQIHFQHILLSHGRSSSSLKQAHCVPQI